MGDLIQCRCGQQYLVELQVEHEVECNKNRVFQIIDLMEELLDDDRIMLKDQYNYDSYKNLWEINDILWIIRLNMKKYRESLHQEIYNNEYEKRSNSVPGTKKIKNQKFRNATTR